MASPSFLNGSTAVIGIVGDPIAQVKSPAGMTAGFIAYGANAVVVPFHVSKETLSEFISGLSLAKNVAGLIATVPHKFAFYDLCTTCSPRAALLCTVNVLRRNDDGTWYGDIFDGEGFVTSLIRGGCTPAGKRALLVGSGGAGAAIALALLEAGVGELALYDKDRTRCDTLMARLATPSNGRLRVGSDDPTGFDIVINATPSGMQAGDPLPVDVSRLSASAFAADVITAPVETAFLQAAKARGCGVRTGVDMFNGVCELMLAFYTPTLNTTAEEM